jgi:uncharacterized protein YndB with AHSA1/START domain
MATYQLRWEADVVPDKIERELVLKHPIDRVWTALTTAEGLAGWFGSTAEIDLRPGGRLFLRWDELGAEGTATVETVEPPHRFSFWWGIEGLPDDDPRRTLVEFTLTAVEEGTLLRLVESGFAQVEEEIGRAAQAGNTEGWDSELGDLVAYLDAA